jgi:hypothetical protein
MSVLTGMDARFDLRASEPPATDKEIDELRAFARTVGGTLPDDYVDLLRDVTEVEILVEQRGCIRFWAPAGVLEMNDAHELQRYIPHAIAVGDDEGGMAFVFMTGRNGRGLYRLSFADPDPMEAVFIAESVEALLVSGVGIDRLFAWEDDG